MPRNSLFLGRSGVGWKCCQEPTGSYLAVTANGSATLLTCVGVELFEAGHTVWVLLLQDVLLAIQRLIAVVAVKAFSHVDTWFHSNL